MIPKKKRTEGRERICPIINRPESDSEEYPCRRLFRTRDQIFLLLPNFATRSAPRRQSVSSLRHTMQFKMQYLRSLLVAVWDSKDFVSRKRRETVVLSIARAPATGSGVIGMRSASLSIGMHTSRERAGNEGRRRHRLWRCRT